MRVKTGALDRLIAENHGRMKEAEVEGSDLGPYREAHLRLQNEKKELQKRRLTGDPAKE